MRAPPQQPIEIETPESPKKPVSVYPAYPFHQDGYLGGGRRR